MSASQNKRKDLMLQVDKNREMIYLACKEKAYNAMELKEKFGFTFHQTKNYLQALEESKHLEKIKFYSKPKKCWIAQYKATELVFKPKTEQQVIDYLERTYGIRTRGTFGEGKFDNLIANNPNLRKVKLFDTKDHSYFLNGQTGKVNRGIASTWSLYESASGFDS